MSPIIDVRPSPIAGQWYPANPARLAQEVDGYLDRAKLPDIPGEAVGVVAPHAGHRYSGPVAGYAFAAIRDLNPEIVAVVSPLHYMHPDPLLTTAHDAYATPLGPVRVDCEAVRSLHRYLKRSAGLGLSAIANDPEHSLEIELPFLQRALGGPFDLLPVMLRDQSQATVRWLGEGLAHVLRERRALLVASSDLSHFYPQPVAAQLDNEFLRQVEAFDPVGVLQVEKDGRGFACGRGAVASVLWAAKGLGAKRVQLLHYATSGDVTGDYNRVVGYAAAVIYK